MLQIPVTARASGLGEEYLVAVPVGVIKEDLQQIIEDGDASLQPELRSID